MPAVGGLKKLVLVAVLAFVVFTSANGQTHVSQKLLAVKATSDSLNRNFAPEKLFVQFDRDTYAPGDTLWFKGWLINGPTYMLSAKSKFLHIDIATDSNKVIKQYLFPVNSGLSWGNISLPDHLAAGTYTVRAYTRWMRNFSLKEVFYKNINIVAANEQNLLVSDQNSLSVANNKTLVNSRLRFSDTQHQPAMLKAMQVSVVNGKSVLSRNNLQTDLNGELNLNFALPATNSNLRIVAKVDDEKSQLTIPINFYGENDIDVQFLPESGKMVAGIKNRVGVKVIGKDGRGIDVTGVVFDAQSTQAAVIKTTHKGMGSFYIDAIAGAIYYAAIKLPNGQVKNYQLPQVQSSGTVLQVDNLRAGDSVNVAIAATPDVIDQNNSYILLAKARGVICYAGIVSFGRQHSTNLKVAKALLPTGVTHFMLLNAKGGTLNERLAFINHHDQLSIKLSPKTNSYAAGDSVILDVAIADREGKPVEGNFTLAVTDDSLVKPDTLADNINTRMLLTSEVKGYVEEPEYYFTGNANAAADADNLMLTQGWADYDTTPNPSSVFLPEIEYTASGTVLNVFNKPVKASKVVLLSNRPFYIADTVTNSKGYFKFKLPVVDTPVYFIQAVNKNGKSFNVGVTVNEDAPLSFSPPLSPLPMPWYINANDTTINYVKNTIAYNTAKDNMPAGSHTLKEVKIVAKKIVKDSQNLNGPGNADIVLDEKELEKQGKKTLIDLLYERVPGFAEYTEFVYDPDKRIKVPVTYYRAKSMQAVFLMDGVELNKLVDITGNPDIRSYFKYHTAEDVKGIEVNASAKYSFSYLQRFYPASPPNLVFIEITTRGGQGLINTAPGVYLYKPIALSLPKQFYTPRYVAEDAVNQPPRPTVYWQPDVVTDVNGHATVSFLKGQGSSAYNVIIQGMSYDGFTGYTRQVIKFKPNI